MKQTLRQLDREFRAFAVAHRQLNGSYFFGNFNQLYNEQEIKHSTLIIDTLSTSPGRVKGAGSYDDVSFLITVCDQLFPYQSIWLDVKNDLLLIITDIRNIFESQRWKSFSAVQGTPTANWFEQRGTDRVNGWSMNVTLRVIDMRDLCAIPLIDYDLDSDLQSSCEGVIIIENGNYLETVPSGGTFSYSTGGGGDVVIDINSKLYSTETAPSTINIPVLNSNADDVGTVTSSVNVVILDSAAQINGVTFEMIPAETTLNIPVLNSNGDPIGVVDPAVQVNVEDSFVENTGASYSNQFPSGTTFVLPDINLTQPNGDIEVNPSMTDLSCTLISALANQDLNDDLTPTQINRIQRQQPLRTGQVTSYRTGDDANLQMGIGATFSTLSDNNIFGTNQRFTDELGGQTYTNKFVLDHSTGLMWYIALTTATQWNGAIDGALASTQGTFTDWSLPNMNQLISICNFSTVTNALLNYAPFNIAVTTSTDRIWTSTTVPNATANAYTLQSNSTFAGTGKSTSQSYIICRKFIPSDFGL